MADDSITTFMTDHQHGSMTEADGALTCSECGAQYQTGLVLARAAVCECHVDKEARQVFLAVCGQDAGQVNGVVYDAVTRLLTALGHTVILGGMKGPEEWTVTVESRADEAQG